MGRTVDKEKLIALIEPPLAALGYELADLDVHLGRRGLLRLFNRPRRRVKLEDCERVSEQLGAWPRRRGSAAEQLRARGVVAGLRSRLRTLAHFTRFRG
jgi:ribosome maturation factor RimP